MQTPNVVWKPLTGSQTLALSCPASVILYHGTRGPGKTDAQLMRFRRNVGVGYGAFWRGVIFDREYKNLDDLIAKSKRWFKQFGDGARFLSSKADYKWVWPTGEELLFRAIKKPEDYWLYHGQEFPFIGWNELTKYPDPKLYNEMMSCNRSSFLPEENKLYVNHDGVPCSPGDENAIEIALPEIPLEVFATTNPFGAGHNWVKKEFINKGVPGEIVRTEIDVFNPRTKQRETFIKTQTHIFGSYKENRYLSPQYVATLEGITEPNKREAWLRGSWDITSGGMFDDLWSRQQHVVKPFAIPSSWRVTRSFDYGSSAPFSVGWWAISDGTEFVDHEGVKRSSIRGDAYRIGEWYGTSGQTNEGLRILSSQITTGIIEWQLAASLHERVQPGPADNSIWDVLDGNSIAVQMSKPVTIKGRKYNGVQWVRSDKSPGSRKAGWRMIREYLSNALPQKMETDDGETITVPRSKPGMFVFSYCNYFLDLFPSLPRDEDDLDDVDTDAEDHIGDETRYFILGQKRGASGGKAVGLG